MQKITTFLWFTDQAEEAAHFYTSLFSDSRITDTTRLTDGATSTVTFELAGQQYIAMNSGQPPTFNESISFYVDCADQDEVDRLWTALTSEGGRESLCGWLTDRYGLSWQIVPRILPKLLADPNHVTAAKALKAMQTMAKINIRELIAATES